MAVLRLYAAASWLRNACTILAERGERITQLQYLLQLSLRTSENSVKAKFAEFYFHTPGGISLSTLFLATLSSQLVATKIIRWGGVLGAYGCYLSGLGKERIRLCWDNRRAPKRCTMAADSENALRESMGCVLGRA